ncbi:MAG: respiratory nitrate reductase subunit gamma [Pseudomonadota bacterium]|uniref:respiratory nitrate reductase subunit gamma n=1 Tax=Thermithiobacillus tepidarius TaxID=929 RepID=UPI0004240623|nr:respiratory nitrate reductase subunit gamma [Thermithiobacillus tepidarius]
MDNLDYLLFGIYPYVGLAIFLLGSLFRFEREQYTWKSDSSQLLRLGQLRLGSNLFHIGILFLFFGHLFGLLTPHWLYESFGLSTPDKQMLAIISGGIAGMICLVGLVLLIHRRLVEPRIRATTRPMDLVVLFWLLITLVLGLITTYFSYQHRDGSVMLLLAGWAQHILTFRGGAVELIAPVPIIYKIHIWFGMTVFVLFPFSRLVHVWSGFAAVAYPWRSYQVVRPK